MNGVQAWGDWDGCARELCDHWRIAAPDLVLRAPDLVRSGRAPEKLRECRGVDGRQRFVSGVYLWLEGDTPLYAGKGARLWNRIADHWNKPEEVFSFVAVWREDCAARGVEPDPVVLVWLTLDRDRREEELIVRLAPRYNVRARGPGQMDPAVRRALDAARAGWADDVADVGPRIEKLPALPVPESLG